MKLANKWAENIQLVNIVALHQNLISIINFPILQSMITLYIYLSSNADNILIIDQSTST